MRGAPVGAERAGWISPINENNVLTQPKIKFNNLVLAPDNHNIYIGAGSTINGIITINVVSRCRIFGVELLSWKLLVFW